MPARPRGRPGPDGRLDALVMRARVAFSVNDDEAPYWTEAVGAAEGSEKLAGVLAEAVITMSKVVGPLAVAPWAARLRVLRGQVPPALRTEVDIAWGAVAGMAGQAEGTEAVRAALGAANLASVMGSASPMLFPRMLALAIDSRYLVERFDEADDLVAAGWEIAERRGAVMTLTYLALLRAMGNCWRGRLAHAHKALGDLAGIQAAAGLREAQEHWAGVLATLALEEGDASMASSEAGKAEPLVSAQNFGARLGLWRLRAELALDAGHTSEAVRLAKEIRDLYQRLGILEPCWVPWADTAMVAFLRARFAR